MKNIFLIYVLSSLMLGSSLHSIGQKRYHIDEIYIQTTTSGWTHVHDPSPRRLDEYRVVTYIGPALLKKNDEPVTGVIYDTYPNGQIKYKTRWKRGIKVGKSKRWYENGQVKKKVKWLNNSSTNECWDEDGNKIECD